MIAHSFFRKHPSCHHEGFSLIKIVFVVEYHGEPIKDGIYVIRLEDTLLVKRLQRLPGHSLQVSSDNPTYSVFNVSLARSSTDFAIIGRVVWAGKRF